MLTFCLSQDDYLISDTNTQEEIFADPFSGDAAHEPLSLDYRNAENEKLNYPFQLSELRKTILPTKSTSRGKDKISMAFLKGLQRML